MGLLGELLLSPNTRGGLLLPDYVERERERLAERIRARRNNKDAYAVLRLVELMCACESISVGALGSEQDAENIGYVALSKHYKALLASAPVEVFYCGGGGLGRGGLRRLRRARDAAARGDRLGARHGHTHELP